MYMEEKENNEEIEVVMGDDSILEISSVKDCMNDLRPKTEKKKNIVIPGRKKDKNKQ